MVEGEEEGSGATVFSTWKVVQKTGRVPINVCKGKMISVHSDGDKPGGKQTERQQHDISLVVVVHDGTH